MIDLVVVGGGQAGLAAGAAAAERGLRVVVCEKTARIGGSAYFSAGILWTAPDVATARALLPDGDPELGPARWSRASSPPWPRRATPACR